MGLREASGGRRITHDDGVFAEDLPWSAVGLAQHQGEDDFFLARTEVHLAGSDHVADATVFRGMVEVDGGVQRRGVLFAQLAEERHILRVVKAGDAAIFLHDDDAEVGRVQLGQRFKAVVATGVNQAGYGFGQRVCCYGILYKLFLGAWVSGYPRVA